MKSEPTYEELIVIRQALEQRIAELEQAVDRYSEMPDVLHDTGLFGELFKKAADMIIVNTMKTPAKAGRIVLANPAALIQLEYSLEELQKMTMEDLMEPVSDLKQDPIYPETVKYERIFLTKSKRRVYSEVYSHIFIHGNDRYQFAIIRNITGRRTMEMAVRKSEEKYKRLVESLHTEYIFYSHDSKGMITYVSPSITKVMGYTPDEAMRNYKEFLTDHEMNKEALKHSEGSLKGKIQPPFLNELYHRDGSTRIFYNTELPLFDENGKVTGVEGIAHDVTESFRTEEELRKQEEMFRLLVETIEEVFWIHDLKQDKLLYISPKYEVLYGRTTEGILNNPGSFLKSVHPDDIDQVKLAYKNIAKGTGLDIEYRITDPEGTEKMIWSRSVVILDKRNKPSLSIGTALDITEKKKAQREKDLLAAIIENFEDLAVIKDTDLRIIASNPANTLAAGKKSADELIGKTDLEIYGDFEHVRQYMDDDRTALLLKKGETLVNEQVFVFPDGKKIQSLVKKFPIYDQNEKLIAVAAISRDISDYKNTLQELYESEEKYRLLINNQGEGIGMVDPQDTFLFVNPKAEEIFGVPEGKLVGKSLFDFLDSKGAGIIQQQTEARKKGEKGSYEVEIMRPGGEKRQMLITATPQYTDEQFIGTFAVFRDITDWKIAEKDILHSEKELREANAAKDKFFSIIAHDLRNPFNSILGFSDLMLKHYESYDQEEVLTFIKMINEASKQAYNLLENLLNWTRSQTGRIQFEPAVIDVFPMIEKTLQLYEGHSLEKNQVLVNSVKQGSVVYGDINMVSTIFRNLVSNAIKFSQPKGRITVRSKNQKNMVDILVADNGVGIPEEIKTKLFRIDENVTRSGTANEEGTGLGLILCQEFAQRNHGSIRVESKVGKGTTFTVSLPKPDTAVKP
jgi:PAS domain S-box-containing protein